MSNTNLLPYENIIREHIADREGSTWLDMRHPDYRAQVSKWNFARDHYESNVLDGSRVSTYLVRKAQAESEPAYLERTALADYTPHFSTVVDSLAGMLFAVEGDAIRFLGDEERPGLGDPTDEKSSMHRLWKNADGQGTGWLTIFKQLAIELIASHCSWMVVDQDARGRAAVRHWPAPSVINWWHDPETGDLAEVLISEVVDKRASIKESTAEKFQRSYVLYTREGWERWEKTKEGKAVQVGGQPYGRPFVNEDREPILPIYPVVLPMNRHVGWTLAKKANAIFNKESERDHLLRTANFPLLILVGTDAQFASHVEDLKRGVRALRHDPQYSSTHQFIGPDSGPAAAVGEVLKRKVEEFYVTAFREYGDAAREKTATEVRQDVASGVGAFLGLLKAAVDDAENEALKRVAQIEHPNDERRWFVNHVERSDSFIPSDIQQIIQGLKDRYFAPQTPLPIGPTGLINVLRDITEFDGVQIDENEIKAAVMTGELSRLVDLFKELPVPAEVRVKLTLDLIVALGAVDPEEAITLADGAETKMIDVLRAEMLKLAQADDEARKRMAAPLDFGPPPPGGPPPPPTPPQKEEEEEEDE